MPEPPEDRHHPILEQSWTYDVTQLQIDFAAKRLVMVLNRRSESATLLFADFDQLSIDEGYNGTSGGLQILDCSSRGMERARVRACHTEPEPGIRFWAKEVERLS